jgi:hypothetical protein
VPILPRIAALALAAMAVAAAWSWCALQELTRSSFLDDAFIYLAIARNVVEAHTTQLFPIAATPIAEVACGLTDAGMTCRCKRRASVGERDATVHSAPEWLAARWKTASWTRRCTSRVRRSGAWPSVDAVSGFSRN